MKSVPKLVGGGGPVQFRQSAWLVSTFAARCGGRALIRSSADGAEPVVRVGGPVPLNALVMEMVPAGDDGCALRGERLLADRAWIVHGVVPGSTRGDRRRSRSSNPFVPGP